jgi:transcriptional regulator with XRE-family HTH domain
MPETDSWAARFTRGVAAEIQRRRKELGWSAQKLSDECAGLGMEFPRSTLADLETGRRVQLSVAELVVLARALSIPPLLLIFPVGTQDETELLPGITRPVFRSAQWFAGAAFFPGPDDAGVVTTVSAETAWPGQPLVLYREHDRFFEADQRAMASAMELDMTAALGSPDAGKFTAGASAERQLAAGFRAERERLRDQARALGFRPPDQPTVWLIPDDGDAGGQEDDQ